MDPYVCRTRPNVYTHLRWQGKNRNQWNGNTASPTAFVLIDSTTSILPSEDEYCLYAAMADPSVFTAIYLSKTKPFWRRLNLLRNSPRSQDSKT